MTLRASWLILAGLLPLATLSLDAAEIVVGQSATFGPNRNQGFDRVHLTTVRGGKIVSLD